MLTLRAFARDKLFFEKKTDFQENTMFFFKIIQSYLLNGIKCEVI